MMSFWHYGSVEMMMVLFLNCSLKVMIIVNKPSAVTKDKAKIKSKACGLNCYNECDKNLNSYFNNIDMCEDCVIYIEHECSQYQIASLWDN